MNDHLFGMLDMAIVGIAVLGLAGWQLVSINREIGRDEKPPVSPERPGHAVGEHRLDDR